MGWPLVLPGSTAAEVFDRARLLIDLDEATDPESPPTVLLVVGVPRDSNGADPEPSVAAAVERLGDRVFDLVGNDGAIYQTRATEVCVLLDGTLPESNELVALIGDEIVREAGARSPISIGRVSLPDETLDAITALTIADKRMRVGTLSSLSSLAS